MRKRTKWKAHEVGYAINLALSFERCLANEAWCRRYLSPNNDEILQWHDQARGDLVCLRDLGLPDGILRSLIGFNNNLNDFNIATKSDG